MADHCWAGHPVATAVLLKAFKYALGLSLGIIFCACVLDGAWLIVAGADGAPPAAVAGTGPYVPISPGWWRPDLQLPGLGGPDAGLTAGGTGADMAAGCAAPRAL